MSLNDDLHPDKCDNHTEINRNLSSPHRQTSNQKTYEQGTYNQLLGIDVKEKLPDVFNLVDGETWTFKENFLVKFLSVDQPNGPPAFSKIGIVGKQGVGKSSLLNKLAGKDVFKSHQTSGNEFLLKHVTEGRSSH